MSETKRGWTETNCTASPREGRIETAGSQRGLRGTGRRR